MSKGAFELISEILPNYKSEIANYQEIRNSYHSDIANLKEKNQANPASNGIPIESASDEIQRKHHEIINKIKNKGRFSNYTYNLSDSNSENIAEELEELVDEINDEIESVKKRRKRFLAIPLIAILIPLILQVI
ncbi:hypothetical protein [Candidatus Nanohalococcus occultus]|uniref:hypothetical protein n=1 Tax=Candidatus Nanohalococcus occultus TaxID=2978047 RepID=UPI0039DF6369